MAEKTTRTTKAARSTQVTDVAKLLLHGKTRSEIFDYCERVWGLKPTKNIDDIIEKATKRIKEVNITDVENEKAKIIKNLWSLYLRSLKKENLPNARQVLMDIAKLRGLDIQKVIHEHRELENETDEDIDGLEDLVAEGYEQ